MDDLERHVERLDRASSLLGRRFAAALNHAQLSAPQYMTLRFIGHSCATNPSALAQYFGISMSAVTQNIRRLMRADLVRQYEDESNRRYVIIELTDRGRQLLAETELQRRGILRDLVAQLSPTELATFVATMEKLVGLP